jgi:hypothetical protein
MIERKEIASLNIGGRTLFDRKDLDELIERAKTPGEQPGKTKGRKGRAPARAERSGGHKKSAKSTRSTSRK